MVIRSNVSERIVAGTFMNSYSLSEPEQQADSGGHGYCSVVISKSGSTPAAIRFSFC